MLTRRRILKCLAAIAAVPSALFVAGCGATKTVLSALISTLGTAVAAIATIEGNTSLASKITLDTQAAVGAINNWTPGSVATDVIQVLQIVAGDLILFIPVSAIDQSLILLARSTVDELLADFGVTTSLEAFALMTPAKVAALAGTQYPSEATVRKIHSALRTSWNRKNGTDPARAKAVIQ